jgi:hypothetical protein
MVALLTIVLSYAQTGVPGQITTSFVQVRDYGSSGGPVTRPCMLWLPADYPGGTTPDYPLIVFFHGHGQRGNPNGSNVNDLKTYSPFEYLDNEEWDGTAPGYGGECANTNYIVFAFQTDEDFSNAEIDYALQQLRLRFRFSEKIIFTGPSGGGGTTYSYAMDLSRTYKPKHIIPMSVPTADFTNVSTVAGNGMNVWAFADDVPNVEDYYTTTTSIVSAFNNAVSNSAKFTGRSLGHCCWNDYYDPSYREYDNDGSNDYVNIYEWALKRMPSNPIGFGCPAAAVSYYGKFAGYISASQTDKVGSCNTTCWTPIYTDDGTISTSKVIYDEIGYIIDGQSLHYGYNSLQLNGGPGDKHLVINSSGVVTTYDNCISPAGYVSTAGYGDPSGACVKSCSTLVYSNASVIATGIKLFNSDGTTAFAGNWADYGFTTTQYGTAQRRLNIDGGGIILTDVSCSGGGSRMPGEGITETALNKTVRIFPNPAAQQLNIQTGSLTEPVNVQLYNMSGVQVYQSTITRQTVIQVGKFTKGVYMLKLITASGKLLEAQKIIIQ